MMSRYAYMYEMKWNGIEWNEMKNGFILQGNVGTSKSPLTLNLLLDYEEIYFHFVVFLAGTNCY